MNMKKITALLLALCLLLGASIALAEESYNDYQTTTTVPCSVKRKSPKIPS